MSTKAIDTYTAQDPVAGDQALGVTSGGNTRLFNLDTIPDQTAMPTVSGDAIVESGSNSDGEWTRWADGTQWAQAQPDGQSISAGSKYTWAEIPWAKPFISSNFTESSVFGIIGSNVPSSAADLTLGIGSDTGEATDETVVSCAAKNSAGGSRDARPRIHAIARWK